MTTHARHNLKIFARKGGYASYRNEFSKAKAGYTPLPVAPEPGDSMVGYITLRTKEIAVEQVDGRFPPYAMVVASRIWPHDPKPLPDETVRISRFTPAIYVRPPGTEYCCACGDWVKREGFSPDRRKRNGLQSHCKLCEAGRKRIAYRSQKVLL